MKLEGKMVEYYIYDGGRALADLGGEEIETEGAKDVG